MGDACGLCVHVTPKSGKDQIVGVGRTPEGMQELRIRVTAPPDQGKANAAVCKLVARELGIAKSSVGVAAGTASRHKRLEIAIDARKLQAFIDSLPLLPV